MSLQIRTLDSLDVQAKRVLVRCDFNVPLNAGRITDDTRIRAALPTIKNLLERGAKCVVLMSHLGRPKGEVVEELRLQPVTARLAELLEGVFVMGFRESVGPTVQAQINDLPEGSVALLENVRFHPGETKGDADLAARFAELGDVFVNDAFGTSHRDHSSVCGLARILPSAGGLLLQREIDAFEKVLNDPARPLAAILGGAKVSDKLKVIDHLLDTVDRLLIGGGMAYTFLKAKGHTIGTSLFQEDQLDLVKAAIAQAESKGVQLLLPSDHVVGHSFEQGTETQNTGVDIPDGWMGMDIGPESAKAYVEAIAGSKTVVWNGPMGVFEWPQFEAGTKTVGEAVASCDGLTVVGGGDSVAAAEKFGFSDRIDHLSTGGGASLELLEGKVLPGIAALQS